MTIPGPYTTFTVFGNFSSMGGGTFTTDGPLSRFSRDNYAVPPTPAPTSSASVTPIPTPTPGTPAPTPTPKNYYIYTGSYMLAFPGGATPTTGCVSFFATQDGSGLFGLGDNANGSGFLNTTLTAQSNVASGAATVNLTVTGSTGSGTITLADGETGTITITGRSSISFDRIRRPR